jgi:hypothetical protein
VGLTEGVVEHLIGVAQPLAEDDGEVGEDAEAEVQVLAHELAHALDGDGGDIDHTYAEDVGGARAGIDELDFSDHARGADFGEEVAVIGRDFDLAVEDDVDLAAVAGLADEDLLRGEAFEGSQIGDLTHLLAAKCIHKIAFGKSFAIGNG